MPQFRIDIAHFFGDCSMPDDGSGQGSVVREDPLVLHDLADLAAVAFYSIGRGWALFTVVHSLLLAWVMAFLVFTIF